VEGYRIETSVSGLTITAQKCGPLDGDWTITFRGSPGAGVDYAGQLSARIDRGSGSYALTGRSTAGGHTFTHGGKGTLAFTDNGDRVLLTLSPATGSAVMNADPRVSNSGTGEPVTVEVLRDGTGCR
jgi:hypothetical protein